MNTGNRVQPGQQQAGKEVRGQALAGPGPQLERLPVSPANHWKLESQKL